MIWLHDMSYLFGGAFFVNAVPHFVSGVLGRPFQSPFAKPPGQGLSSSRVNVLWGAANFVLAYFLILQVGRIDLRAADQAGALGLGALLCALLCAHLFGCFHGGRSPAA
ncbi:hypothetical protein GALL_99280 [mine drainage metagenome]|uniref:Uncharacterized protein n=1 Tax=mine drainage metagenome TaxID=410659 RepID=A0A1J5SHZ5_9ZZZZ